MAATNEDMNAELLKQLECPVCLETCTANIFMCINGHIFCSTCSQRLNMCSVCRAPGRPDGRCNPLEQIAKMVRLPCENEPQGCPLTFTITDMKTHLPTCDFGLECLICTDWRGSVDNLKEHVAQAHALFSIVIPPAGMKSLKCVNLNIIPVRVLCMFSFDGVCFWYESNYSNSILTSTMRLVSHDETQASRYYFIVEYASKLDKLKVSYQNNVLSLTAPADDGATNISLPRNLVASTALSEVVNNITIALK